MFRKITSLSNLTLLVALSLSSVAAYYSIIGLTAIFAGAVIPVIIMGSILEVGKITTTVWLRKYWNRCSWVLKLYLVPAVVALALLTSMGIFGFLSKAHMDQGVTSGDVQAKLALYDEKIKTQRDNIELARKALQQMDAQVDQRLSRGDSEAGAERAVQIRRQQAGERAKLQKEIGEAQKEIAKLNEERAPIAAENRKVEAEVGPIKYIAALIYGDNADNNTLESAVRWVIILLVIVFDPLAIALVLAANASKEWDKEVEDKPDAWVADVTMPEPGPGYDVDNEQIGQVKDSSIKFKDLGEHPKDFDEKAVEEPIIEEEQLPEPDPVKKSNTEKSLFEENPYLLTSFAHFKDMKPLVYTPEEIAVEEKPKKKRVKKVPTPAITVVKQPKKKKPVDKKVSPKKTPKIQPKTEEVKPEILAVGVDVTDRPGDYLVSTEIKTEGVTNVRERPYKEINETYVTFEGKNINKDALKSLRPDLFSLKADKLYEPKTDFGTSFPTIANKGDIFVRVDTLPNRVYKFDGRRWIEVNKEQSESYLDEKYTNYLIEKVGNGEYDPDLLTDSERAQIEEILNQKN